MGVGAMGAETAADELRDDTCSPGAIDHWMSGRRCCEWSGACTETHAMQHGAISSTAVDVRRISTHSHCKPASSEGAISAAQEVDGVLLPASGGGTRR